MGPLPARKPISLRKLAGPAARRRQRCPDGGKAAGHGVVPRAPGVGGRAKSGMKKR